MNNQQVSYKTDLSYIAITAIAVIFSWEAHESAHWLAGTLLGNAMAMTMNTTFPVNGYYEEQWHEMVVSAAGPLFTLMQAIVVYALLLRKDSRMLFPFLVTPVYMRVLAGVLNGINANDEGRIGRQLGIGLYTLSVIVCAILIAMLVRVVKRRQYPRKFVLITFVLIIFFSSVIIMADKLL